MDEAAATSSGAGRRNEDIALDLMKFIAMTTSYGKTASSGGVGFTGGGAAAKPEDYAAHLLELYGKCLGAVGAKEVGRDAGCPISRAFFAQKWDFRALSQNHAYYFAVY